VHGDILGGGGKITVEGRSTIAPSPLKFDKLRERVGDSGIGCQEKARMRGKEHVDFTEEQDFREKVLENQGKKKREKYVMGGLGERSPG